MILHDTALKTHNWNFAKFEFFRHVKFFAIDGQWMGRVMDNGTSMGGLGFRFNPRDGPWMSHRLPCMGTHEISIRNLSLNIRHALYFAWWAKLRLINFISINSQLTTKYLIKRRVAFYSKKIPYCGGIRFESRSTHDCWALSKCFIPSFGVWSVTKNNAFGWEKQNKMSNVEQCWNVVQWTMLGNVFHFPKSDDKKRELSMSL